MKGIVIILVTLCSFFSVSLYGQLPAEGVFLQGGGWGIPHLGFDQDKKESFTNLVAIPENIYEAACTNLQARLGPEWYRRVRFSDVMFVPIEKLEHSREWEVPSYCFSFQGSVPEIGVKQFIVGVKLRLDGTLMKPIQFPDFANLEKQSLVSMNDAYEIAKDHGFVYSTFRVEVRYDTELELIVWEFSAFFDGTDMMGKYNTDFLKRTFFISAHDGAVLKKHEVLFIQGHQYLKGAYKEGFKNIR